MKPFKSVIMTALAAFLLSLGPSVSAQRIAANQEPAKKGTKVSERELQAFVRAYVDYHKIRQAYEPALKSAKNPAASKNIQDEANAKVKEALAKQHLSVQEYNRVFQIVNDDEELRRKAMKLIEHERDKG